MTALRRWRQMASAVAIALAACALPATAQPVSPETVVATQAAVVPVAELTDAIRAEHARGYNLRATSNGARLQAAVILQLARRAHATDSLGSPFTITAEHYEQAFMRVLQIPQESLPVFVRIATEYAEDLTVEYRNAKVIAAVVRGPSPRMAVRVYGGWSDTARRRYSYEDKSGSPHLRVIHQRDTRYTLLDYGDMIVQDNISGIGGRAISGLLGVAFILLGDAEAVQSRFAIAGDGVQVARVSAKALFSKTQTVTVTPDGVGSPGIPKGRNDLSALEGILKQKIELRYVPDSVR